MRDVLAIADGLWPYLLGAVLAWLALSVLRLRSRVGALEARLASRADRSSGTWIPDGDPVAIPCLCDELGYARCPVCNDEAPPVDYVTRRETT